MQVVSRITIMLLLVLLGSVTVLRGQINQQGEQYINESLGLDQDAINQIMQPVEQGGEQARWLTLGVKTAKLVATSEVTKAKAKERELERSGMAQLAVGLRKTKQVFESYYDKYRNVSGGVQTIHGLLKISKRVRRLVDLLGAVRMEFLFSPQFSSSERGVIMRSVDGLVDRTERLIDDARMAVLDQNTSDEELDEIREEHGEVVALMRSIDRTQQLSKIDREFGVIIGDIENLVIFLRTIKNKRDRETHTDSDFLRALLDGND